MNKTFSCELPHARSVLTVLSALVVHKPQWVTLYAEPRRSLLVRSESDDMSVQGTATIPLDWFSNYNVTHTLDICVELHGFLQCLQMGTGSVAISYPDPANGGLALKWEGLQCVVLPRQTYTRPLDLKFGDNNAVNRLECDGHLLRDIITTFELFGSSQITLAFEKDHVVFESGASPGGGLSVRVDAAGDPGYRIETAAPGSRSSYLSHHIVAALANHNCLAALPERVSVATNNNQQQRTSSTLLRVVHQWKGGAECLTNAIVEMVIVPMMMT